jgi:hypothetical protein
MGGTGEYRREESITYTNHIDTRFSDYSFKGSGRSSYTSWDENPSSRHSIISAHSTHRRSFVLHVYLDRESQHRLMSCMRMKTCMKMVAV